VRKGKNMINLYGSYIGEFIEVVIIKKYTLLFRNNTEKNILESYFLYTDNFKCAGICFSETDMTTAWGLMIEKNQPEKIRYAYGFNENNIYATDEELKNLLGKNNLISVNETNGKYEIVLYDGSRYSVEKHETYENGDIAPKSIDATPDNLGVCLREWSLGLGERHTNDGIIGIELNTPKHMYMFQLTHDFIYCRAATYATCNKGFFFLQNFRQNFHSKAGNSMMRKDNRDALKDAAEFMDEELFDPEKCINSYGIYWSVHSFDKDTIIFHGCGGEEYHHVKPQI
jgi:hypothetical protein